ncbi:MAG TPA: alpha/beta hydrolase [Candidatus Baltobacteraceae bacterium]
MLRTSKILSTAPAPTPHVTWRRREIEVAPAGKIVTFETGRDDPSSPALLLIHGLGHWTQGAWDHVAAQLADTHRIVAFDLPGFGDSDKPDVRYDLDFFCGVTHAVVRTLGLQRYHLVGHSLGGMIAADYAGRHPGEIASLTLIDPAGFLRTPKIFVRILAGEPVARLFTLRPSHRFVRRLLLQAVRDPSAISAETYQRAYKLAEDPRVCRAFLRVYSGALRTFLDMPGFHAKLARYAGPALLVWGRHDEYTPIRALNTARKVYPHARTLVLDDCGHCPNVEAPTPIADVIRSMSTYPEQRAAGND